MPRRNKPNGQDRAAVADPHPERLSPVTENYLLCLYRLGEDSVVPTITQLTDTLRQLPVTEGLGTSVPSVSGMIRRMQRQTLVELGPDKRIRLTQKGLEGAEDIARRHRLAEWLVVRLLGMPLHRAHSEAHRLEHGMSQEFQESLLERLGYPSRSPYGRAIPGVGEPKVSGDTLSLEEAVTGVTYLVDRVPEEDMDLLRFLAEALIIPEHEVKVVEGAPYLGVLKVATQRDNVSIGYNVARQIMLRRPDPAGPPASRGPMALPSPD